MASKRDHSNNKKADEDLVEMFKKWASQIQEKVGAKVMRISELNPVKKHKHSAKEKINGKSFEIWFDGV